MAFKTTRWTLANILPVLFVIKIISCLWGLHMFLHLVPLLQSADAAAHQRGVWQTAVSQTITFFMLVCFLRAILTDPGSVPSTAEWQQGAESQKTAELKQTGERRFCKWCNTYKPDRCHHCRVCRSCILRMDHHCPWIANCVGFQNHKFFLLLVLYGLINTIFILATMMETVSKVVTVEMTSVQRFGIVYCMTLASLMGTLLVPFFLLHVSFMFKSQTTIEFCEKRTKGSPITYDTGVWQNVKATLGSNPLLWLLPLSPPDGDGLNFESTPVDSKQDPFLTDEKCAIAAPSDNPEVTSAEAARA